MLYLHPCESRPAVDLVACDGRQSGQVRRQHMADKLEEKRNTHTGFLFMQFSFERPLQNYQKLFPGTGKRYRNTGDLSFGEGQAIHGV